MNPSERLIAADLARGDLYTYSRYMFLRRRGFLWQKANHHPIICDALMRVFNGTCRRLIINMPPRYSKTEVAVINFMAWALGRVPDCEFIHTSYSATLAANNSLQVRDHIEHEAYHEVFPGTHLDGSSSARDHWKTSAGGVVYAQGALGTITGFGAGKVRSGFGGAIIIDDPHKPDEAISDVKRPAVIRWFQNTLESRVNDPKTTPIILIMQRLHEEDLAGWLLAGGNGEEWEHLCLTAIQPDGSALWPEKHDIEALHRMEMASPYVFSGQYMQRPTPAAGGIFKPDQIKPTGALPTFVKKVRAWDLAASDGTGDWTVGALLGLTSDNFVVILDIVRLQGRADEVEAAMLNTARFDGRRVPISIPQDPGQAGKAQIAYLTRVLAGFRVLSSVESGDKVTRALPFSSQVNVGNVSMVPAEWNGPLISEMRNFPFGKYDDQIDALSRGYREITAKRPIIITPGLLEKSSMMRAT